MLKLWFAPSSHGYAAPAVRYVLQSEKNASADGTAARTSARAAFSFARSLKPRYDGTAIASRIPMMTMTTRSSMRVKPSSRASRCRNLDMQISLTRLFRTTRGIAHCEGCRYPQMGYIDAPREGGVMPSPRLAL